MPDEFANLKEAALNLNEADLLKYVMCWHKWGKWITLAEKELKRRLLLNPLTQQPYAPGEQEDVIGRLCEQERICQKCGMKQLRIEKASV